MSNRNKLKKAFAEGAFGVTDVPIKIGHKHLAEICADWTCFDRRNVRRSWKRHRKTRWRAK